ncbi:MAG: hypothetical protein ACKO7G_10310, partial [Gammaproteobacteria bacterium]
MRKLSPLLGPLIITPLLMTLDGNAVAAGPANPLPRAKPESVGMSSERLAARGEFFKRETERDSAA